MNSDSTTPKYIYILNRIGEIKPYQKYSPNHDEILSNDTYISWVYTIYHRTTSGESKEDVYELLQNILDNIKLDYGRINDATILEELYNSIERAIIGITNMVSTVYESSTHFISLLQHYTNINNDIKTKINMLKKEQEEKSRLQKALDFILEPSKSSPSTKKRLDMFFTPTSEQLTQSSDKPEKTIIGDGVKINIRKNSFADIPPPPGL